MLLDVQLLSLVGTTSCVLGTSSGIHAWHNGFLCEKNQSYEK